MKSMTLGAAIALAGALYVVSPAAKAVELDFGSVTPTPPCGTVTSAGGAVCATDLTWSSGITVTTHGFTGAPGPGAGNANQTQKPTALNGLSESGLGVQSTNGLTTCTDPECEIAPPQSVSATATGITLLNDAIIGSIQAGETFDFFVQTTAGGAFTQLMGNLAGGAIDNTCNFPGGSVGPAVSTCTWNAPSGQFRFGVAVEAVTGNELLTAVSGVAVPGPIVGAGLPGLVAACGGLLALARRRRRFVG